VLVHGFHLARPALKTKRAGRRETGFQVQKHERSASRTR
jgi:hypothetical protein